MWSYFFSLVFNKMVCPCANRKGGRMRPVPRFPKERIENLRQVARPLREKIENLRPVPKSFPENTGKDENISQPVPTEIKKRVSRYRYILTHMSNSESSTSTREKFLGGFLPEAHQKK